VQRSSLVRLRDETAFVASKRRNQHRRGTNGRQAAVWSLSPFVVVVLAFFAVLMVLSPFARHRLLAFGTTFLALSVVLFTPQLVRTQPALRLERRWFNRWSTRSARQRADMQQQLREAYVFVRNTSTLLGVGGLTMVVAGRAVAHRHDALALVLWGVGLLAFAVASLGLAFAILADRIADLYTDGEPTAERKAVFTADVVRAVAHSPLAHTLAAASFFFGVALLFFDAYR
jgi:hypothetical protein